MFGSYFTINQQLLIVSVFVIILLSIFSNIYLKKLNLSVFILFVGLALLKIMFIYFDPFVHTWDEQVHALVAKNLSNNFLKPTLFPQDILPYNHENWTGNYIWVHKQPLFLWQIALSFKIFGINTVAVRIPSVICSLLTLLFIFRISKLLYNEKTAFYAVLIFGSIHYLNELLTGFYPTDHNDTVFVFYVTASIWSLVEHQHAPEKKRWILLIGLFAGCAILTKYLTGLFVYAVWFAIKIQGNFKDIFKFKNHLPFFLSFIITVVVALPWQLYILNHFPIEARYEYEYNSKHFFEVIEGHEGGLLFYIHNLTYTLGRLLPYALPFAVFFLWRDSKNKNISIALILGILGVFVFFTIAKTKMVAFPLIVYPYLIIGCASGLNRVFDFIQQKTKASISKITISITLLLCSTLLLDIEKVQETHTNWKKNEVVYRDRQFYFRWLNICKQINHLNLDKDYIIFNCTNMRHIMVMFYTKHIAFWDVPSSYLIDIITKHHKKAAVIDDGNLPEEYKNNPQILVIKPEF